MLTHIVSVLNGLYLSNPKKIEVIKNERHDEKNDVKDGSRHER